MSGLELKIPPLALVALAAALMWAIAAAQIAPLPDYAAREALAVALVLVGFGVAAAGVSAFRRSRTTVNPMRPAESSALVVSGVYRFTRNPMYLGFLLTLVAWAVYLGDASAWLVLPAFVIYMNVFQIGPEERALHARFGEQFEKYVERVRRWI